MVRPVTQDEAHTYVTIWLGLYALCTIASLAYLIKFYRLVRGLSVRVESAIFCSVFSISRLIEYLSRYLELWGDSDKQAPLSNALHQLLFMLPLACLFLMFTTVLRFWTSVITEFNIKFSSDPDRHSADVNEHIKVYVLCFLAFCDVPCFCVDITCVTP